MTNTGRFSVLALDARMDESGSVSAVVSATICCHACGAVSRVTSCDDRAPPGGTVLCCSNCPERQIVSNARLSRLGVAIPEQR